MTFADEAKKLGRVPITIVELDLDYCANTYGNTPCTASVGVTGTQKCFNCFKTCQDVPNYVKTTKTYKFCSQQAFIPIGDTYFPCIKDVDIASTQLVLNKLSVDCSVTVTLQDFTHHDRGIDPYVSNRSYNPEEQGTFFGKLHTRNPFIQNRVMRVMNGYIDEDRVLHTVTQTFLIDRISHPDAKGLVKIHGKGLLRFISEGDRKVPQGNARLNSGISATTTTNMTLFFDDPLADDFGAQGALAIRYAVIEDEIVAYNSRTGNVFTGPANSRGAFGTTIAAHAADVRVRTIFQKGGQGNYNKFPEYFEYFLVNCGGVDPSFIDKTAWLAETDAKFTDPELTIRRAITLLKEYPIKQLIEEILETTGMTMWYDPFAGKIQLKVVDGIGSAVTWDDSVILRDSLSWKELEKERFSQVRFYYRSDGGEDNLPDPNNPITNQVAYFFVDADAQGPNAYNSAIPIEICTRWIKEETAVQEVAERLLALYANMRREIKLRVDAKDATPKVGDYIDLQSSRIQAADGSPLTIRCIVSECHPLYAEMSSHYHYTLVQVVKDPDGS